MGLAYIAIRKKIAARKMLLKRWMLNKAHKIINVKFPDLILIIVIVAALIHCLQYFPNYPIENIIDNIMIEIVFQN